MMCTVHEDNLNMSFCDCFCGPPYCCALLNDGRIEVRIRVKPQTTKSSKHTACVCVCVVLKCMNVPSFTALALVATEG